MRLSKSSGIVSFALGTVAFILASSISLPAEAAFIQYNSRTTFDALGPYVGVDWGAFGPTGTTISTPDSRTVGGVTVQVGSSQGALYRNDEGNTYTGDFTPGDHLLTDAGSLSNSFLVQFGAPVSGFGTQVEIDSTSLGSSYTGGIKLFDASNTLLYTALFSGTKTGAENNSTPFVGVMSDSKNIAYASFYIDQPGFFPSTSGNLAINRLDVQVPEPPSIALFVSTLLGFIGLAFLRHKSQGKSGGHPA